MKNKYFMPLIAIASVLVLSLVTVASYAYFRGTVDGDTPQDMVITTGHMNVTYVDGDTIGTKDNMIPGESVSKFFSVKNTGDVMAAYNIYLTEVANEFVNTDELVYELISEDGTNIAQTECPTDVTMIASDVPIEVGATHNYELKITFLNTDYNQNDNQGTVFNAKISLEEGLSVLYKDRTLYIFKKGSPLDTSKDSTPIEEYVHNINAVAYKKVFSKQYYTTGNTYFYTYLKMDEILKFNTLEECEQTIQYNYLEDNVLNKKCYKSGDYYYPHIAYSYLDDDETVYNVFADKNSCAVGAMEFYDDGDLDEYLENCESTYGDVEKVVYQDVDKSICIMENGHEYCFKSTGGYNGMDSSKLKSYTAQIDNSHDFDCNYFSSSSSGRSSYICVGKYDNASVGFYENGDIYAGKGENRYYRIDLNVKYKTAEQCNANQGDCAYVDGYYYQIGNRWTNSYTDIDSCNSALTDGKQCVSLPFTDSEVLFDSNGVIEFTLY